MSFAPALVDAFLRVALVPRADGHTTGSIAEAEAIRHAHPALARASMHSAAALGDPDAIRERLSRDPGSATSAGGPWGWDPLTTLCFSRYLRLDAARAGSFTESAELLLVAGADPNTGWSNPDHGPTPMVERVLYGAAAVARHVGVTELLLAHGADPNDDETTYHVPESHDLTTLRLLLASGQCSGDSLTTMLLRKADWHDYDGMALLLAHGADPNGASSWGITPLQQSIRRDNDLEHIQLLLDHGGLLESVVHTPSALTIAAARGRSDVLRLAERRGFLLPTEGRTGVLVACALGRAPSAQLMRSEYMQSFRSSEPTMLGAITCAFAGVGNVNGLASLFALGIPVDAPGPEDGYWGLAANVTALHVACWRLQDDVVELLLQHGASVHAVDARGQSPLDYYVRGCTNSYWAGRRTLRIGRALLAAGADALGISRPTGDLQLDELFAR
jgi:ankyrin repeat protein